MNYRKLWEDTKIKLERHKKSAKEDHINILAGSAIISDLEQTIQSLQSQLQEARDECQEQARLNGMGAERELALQAKLAEAWAEIYEWKNKYSEETNSASYARKCWHDEAGNLKAEVARLQGENEHLEMVIDSKQEFLDGETECRKLRERQLEIARKFIDGCMVDGIDGAASHDLAIAALELEANENGVKS